MKYRFGICGPFDFQEKGTGGQSVKTREFYYVLSEKVGKEQISILESTLFKKNPVKFFLNYVKLLRECDHIIIFPAQNGIRFLAPISALFKADGKIHYSVIGGWLPTMVQERPMLRKFLACFDTILVETNVMKRELEALGLKNVRRLLNFKRLDPVSEDGILDHEPIRLCYFSRIAKEKGIEDAITVVKQVNNSSIRCLFDIYGPVIPEYEKEFEKICLALPKEIKYCGKIAPEKSIDTLKEYDIQLFPTRYPTEGIPGSIIDSYFAGVPVLAARWNSFDDVVKNGETGFGYEQKSTEDLYNKLDYILKHKLLIKIMKKNCLEEALKYSPERVMSDFFQIIE